MPPSIPKTKAQRVRRHSTQERPEAGSGRKEEIVSAAEQLLSRDGASAFTLRQVASSSGVSLGHLQHYFANKTELLSALTERWTARFRGGLDKAFAKRGRDGDAVRTMVQTMLDEVATPEGSLGMWELWILAARDRQFAKPVEAMYAQLYDGVARAIEHQQPKTKDAPARARLVIALVEGFCVLCAHADNPALARRRQREQLLRAVNRIAYD